MLSSFFLFSLHVPWRFVFGIGNAITMGLALVWILQFAYEFPKNRHPVESRVVFWISLAVPVLSVLSLFVLLKGAEGRNQVLKLSSIALNAEVAWVFLVLLRKSGRYSSERLPHASLFDRLLRPSGREARALRAFTLLMVIWMSLSLIVLLENMGVLSVDTLIAAVSGAYMLFLFLFVLVYKLS